jgi:hypothetical protein
MQDKERKQKTSAKRKEIFTRNQKQNLECTAEEEPDRILKIRPP